jgi:hypothetical protein
VSLLRVSDGVGKGDAGTTRSADRSTGDTTGGRPIHRVAARPRSTTPTRVSVTSVGSLTVLDSDQRRTSASTVLRVMASPPAKS